MRLSLRVPTFLAPGGYKVMPMSMLCSHDRSTNYVLLHECGLVSVGYLAIHCWVTNFHYWVTNFHFWRTNVHY